MRVLRNTFFTSRRTASRRPVTAATLDDVVAADPRSLGQPERALEMQEALRDDRGGYAILAGTPAPRVGGGVIAWRGGVSYRLLTVNGAAVVTWLRDGHLCVVSGRGVSGATLLRLASWSDRGATAS